jgi:sigma-B regulation protein RsbU (phosphoserine phosphatase)
MSLDSIAAILASPLLAKLLVEAAAISLVLYCRRRELENVSSVFLGVIALMALRDILFQAFALEEIFFVSEILALSTIFFAFSWFYERKVNAILVAVLNLVFLVAFAANMVFAFLPWLDMPLLLAWPALDIVWFSIFSSLAYRSPDSIAQRLAAKAWPVYAALAALLTALAAGFGYSNEWIQRLVVPAYYAAFFVFGYLHLRLIEQQGQRERDYLTSTVDSIYSFMERSGEAFKSAANLDELLTLILRSIMGETKATGGIIAMVDEFDDLLAVKAYEGSFPPCFKLPQELPRKQARVEAYVKHAQFKLGESILGEVAKSGQPLLVDDPAHDGRVVLNGDEDFLAFSSLIVAPFSLGERVVGVMALSRKGGQEVFGDFEFERARMLADFGAIVIRNLQSAMEAAEKSNLEKEAGIAYDIQRILLPKKMVEVGRLSFGSFSSPARSVHSDYFDIIQSRKDRITLVMVDVAGKGIQAALIMVMLRALLHLITNTTRDAATMLGWINRGITGKIEVDHFATVGLVLADLETGEVEYANANQQPLLVVRKATGKVETIELESVPLGVERKTEYASRKIKLGPNDVLVMYTDGVVEAMNVQGKQYGRKRLGELLVKLSGMAAKEIALAVKQDLQEFVGQARQHDDQSLLVMKMKP